MNILALAEIGKSCILGCLSAAIITGGACVANPPLDTSTIEVGDTIVETEVDEGKITPLTKIEIKEEISKEEVSKEETPKKMIAPSATPSPTKKQSTSTNSTYTPRDISDNSWTVQPVEYKYVSIYEFEKAHIGVCPQDVPEGTWPDPLRAGAALGIIGGAIGSKDPMAIADDVWNNMKSGTGYISVGGIFTSAADAGVSTYSDTSKDTYRLSFTLDWPNRRVDWRRTFEETHYKGKDALPADVTNHMDSIAAKMTTRIRQRDAEFKAKCGY